uniref:Uncharacterized protein n=1 Tax=Arundo donax TaxID=35708 RepID=A0A0A9S5Z5_ARUDO
MLLISIARLVHARWTEARDASAQSLDNTTGDEESRPLQNSTGNISVLDEPHPEARNVYGSGASGAVEESHLTQNEAGNNSVRDQLVHEAISNDSQVAHGSSASAGNRELSAMQNGSVPAQSFQIQINTG